ncbi:hypothetical protein WICPIJ_001711 [Wickerhamomyces pijperi]|uniref:Uncharacterized protein n=1 Tax=Wickerhamomyces pijperi TaxID=599730 RepID=A0A9P8TPL6_WICPI|nr:hypothetical protein WICPIJ_001711 [Wickerhamomyces pijperi]
MDLPVTPNLPTILKSPGFLLLSLSILDLKTSLLFSSYSTSVISAGAAPEIDLFLPNQRVKQTFSSSSDDNQPSEYILGVEFVPGCISSSDSLSVRRSNPVRFPENT